MPFKPNSKLSFALGSWVTRCDYRIDVFSTRTIFILDSWTCTIRLLYRMCNILPIKLKVVLVGNSWSKMTLNLKGAKSFGENQRIRFGYIWIIQPRWRWWDRRYYEACKPDGQFAGHQWWSLTKFYFWRRIFIM